MAPIPRPRRIPLACATCTGRTAGTRARFRAARSNPFQTRDARREARFSRLAPRRAHRGAPPARSRARRAPARSSQREAEEESVLASRRGRVVLRSNRDLLESHLAIEVARGEIRRAHLEVHDLAGGRARYTDHVVQEIAADPLVLPFGGHRDVEKVRLVERDHEDRIADHRLAVRHRPAVVAGIHRVAEVAEAPRKSIERLLEEGDLGQVRRAHPAIVDLRNRYRAHRLALRLSSVVRATLSRKYRGAACSAAMAAPRAKRRLASRATAPARGKSPSRRISTVWR